MHRILLPTLVILLLAATSVFAERIELGSSTKDVDITVLESNDTRTVVRFDVGAFEQEAVDVEGETYFKIKLDNESHRLDAAEPELPRICRSIIIPDNAKMAINVLLSEYVELSETPVLPSKGNLLRTINPDDVPYEFGPVYSSADLYPEVLASIRAPYILRDYRATVIDLNAFAYNPATRTLRVYTSVTVEVVNVGPAEVNVFDAHMRHSGIVPDFDMIYKQRFINYDGAAKYVPVGETGDLLIITYDAFASDMQPLVEWKLQKGMKTTMVNVSSIGNNATSIKNFIEDFYDTTDLAYVLLVGDAAQVATPTASGGSSDPTYAKIVGSDDYPDIFVGRFSAETAAHVQTQVARTITYEKNPLAGTWFHKGTGIASNQGPGHNGGEYDNVHMGKIRDSLLSYTYTEVDQIYDPSGTAAQVTTALNNGRSIINYCGHGSTTAWSTTGFSNSNVNALVNNNMLPFIISVACVNGQFNGYTCFAEAWLRATNGSTPTGAIGAYMSSINQSWNPPMDGQDEVSHLLIQEQKSTYGGLCFNGSCKMMDLNPGSAGYSMYDTWHIFGDPSVQVRTDVPGTMNLVHDGALFFAATEYVVEAVGVEGALCALYHDGVMYGSAYTNSGGTATIPISEMLPIGQALTLTVTAYNRETVQEAVTVTSDLAIIVSSPLPDTKDAVNPYEARCTIFSEDDLVADSLLLYYEVNSVWYEEVLQSTLPDGDYYGMIPAQSPGTVINYYFFAVNVAGNKDTTETFTFRVIDYGVLLGPEFSSQMAAVDDTAWYDLSVTNDGVLDDSYSLSTENATWPTTFWDAAGITEITESSSLIADASFDFKVRVIIPSSWEGESDSIDVVATSAGDGAVSDRVAVKTISLGQPWPIPFTETFLTTTLDTYKWDRGAGVVISTLGIEEPSPPYSINFNGNPSGGDTLISESINLKNESNIIVTYEYQLCGGGDSPELADDLRVDYLDEFGVWHNIATHSGGDPDMTEFVESSLTLPAGAYHAGFRIRFWNSGTVGSYDDWFVDNIYVGHPAEYQVRISPSFQEQYGPAGDYAVYMLCLYNEGLYADQYTLGDSLGTWACTFWDETGTLQITVTPSVNPNDSMFVMAKIAIPADAPLNSADTMFAIAASGGAEVKGEAIIATISAGSPAPIPWQEEFETATVDMSHWMVNIGGVIKSNAYQPPSPPYSICLDGGIDSMVSQLIDLSGQSGALFMYYYQRTGPGDSPETGDDLVFEYKNSSGYWLELGRQLGSGPDMTEFEFVQIPLPMDALHNSFQIRMSSFGSAAASDEWFVDDLRIDYAPSIAILPTALDFMVQVGDSAQSEIGINNGGPGTLTYTVKTVPVFDKESLAGRLLLQGPVEPAYRTYPEGFLDSFEDIKGAVDTREGYDVRFNAGGPDLFGYLWVDSDEPGGPVFAWEDIQATGTEVAGLDDDNFVGPFPIGFSFNYYGITYDEFYITSNGLIGFGPTDGYLSRTNTVLPSAGVPNNIISWCWDDLNPIDGANPGSKTYYVSDGDHLVIQFVDYPEFGASAGDVINAEVMIYSSGRIRIQYLSVGAGFDVLSSTVGIENATGDDGLTTVFNSSYIKNNLAVEFMAPALWLTVGPAEGEVAPGEADTLIAKVNTNGLEEGTYASVINVYSNDPDELENPWAIPVNLIVTSEQPYLCGDADGSGTIDIDDAVALIQYIFGGGAAPDPMEAGDPDCSGEVDIDDAVYLVSHIFAGGPAPCAACP
ncbi:MAG: C25 family cysteine peptidase [Candidatus Zixiibacteriota bacterium]